MGLQQFLAPSNVHEGFAIDLTALLLGWFHFHITYLVSFSLALRNILQHGPSQPVL